MESYQGLRKSSLRRAQDGLLVVRVLSGGAGLLGAHHGLGPAWCADRVLLHPKGVGRGAFGGGVGKGLSRPNGIRRGRVQRGRRRSPTGGPKTLPSPVEPAGGARGLAAPETLRASAPNATDRIGPRGEPGQPQVPRTVGQVPCTAANQALRQTGHANEVLSSYIDLSA